MTTSEFWQQAYLTALARAPSPARAKATADQAVADLQALPGGVPVGLLPVYRLRNGAEHFYTIDPVERDAAVATYGYTLEGVAFYAYPPGS